MAVSQKDKERLQKVAEAAQIIIDAVKDRIEILTPGGQMPILILVADQSLEMTQYLTNMRDPRMWVKQLAVAADVFRQFKPSENLIIPAQTIGVKH